MTGSAKKNGEHTLTGRATVNENKGICTVCNKTIKNNNLRAKKIDGLWLCSDSCIDEFLKEKKNWTPKEWAALCSMQVLYEERKRLEINTVNCPQY